MQQAARGHQEPDEDREGHGLQVALEQGLAGLAQEKDVRCAAEQRDESVVQHRSGRVHFGDDSLDDRHDGRVEGGHGCAAGADEEA